MDPLLKESLKNALVPKNHSEIIHNTTLEQNIYTHSLGEPKPLPISTSPLVDDTIALLTKHIQKHYDENKPESIDVSMSAVLNRFHIYFNPANDVYVSGAIRKALLKPAKALAK